jgi:hypothetical protein
VIFIDFPNSNFLSWLHMPGFNASLSALSSRGLSWTSSELYRYRMLVDLKLVVFICWSISIRALLCKTSFFQSDSFLRRISSRRIMRSIGLLTLFTHHVSSSSKHTDRACSNTSEFEKGDDRSGCEAFISRKHCPFNDSEYKSMHCNGHDDSHPTKHKTRRDLSAISLHLK